MTKLYPFNVHAPKWHLAYFCQLMAILSKCFEIWTSNLFCLAFTLTLIYKRACLITLHSNFEIFQKGHPAVEFMLDRRIFER